MIESIRNMKFQHIAFLSLLLVFFACRNSEEKSSSADSDGTSEIETVADFDAFEKLDGIWILKKLDKTTIKNKTSVKNPTLHINISEGTILGNGGCNKYEGKIANEEKEKIEISLSKLTEIGCEKSRLEERYFKAMTNPDLKYILKEEKLILYNDETTLVFGKAE